MKIIVASVLLCAAVAYAMPQGEPAVAAPAPVEPVAAADDGAAAAPAAPAAVPAAAGTGKSASAAAAAPAAPAAPAYGPAFFGPGINNPLAFKPLPALLTRANEVVASNPNVRVFVDTDGTVEFTDQFGREVEVLDSLGRDALDIPGLELEQELHEQRAKVQQQRLALMRQLQALDARLSTGTGAANPNAAAAAPAAAPAPAVAAPAFRIAQ